ncbi:MAG: hypothetical protein IT366_24505 [Candidatus Hydrogenedentes bacterium]|nr:hypothetical protein [Candidatus Hydrogenedentota bacterium]
MSDSPLIAGPPPAEFVAVDNFMPGVDFENDSTYAALILGMPAEDIEVAKALFVHQGVAAQAARILWPDLPDETRKKRASRRANDAKVKSLVDHFKTRAETDSDDKPVTLDEMKKRTRAMFRTCKDPKVFESLLDRVQAMDGIELRSDGAQGPTELEEALQFADRIIAGAPGQSHFTTASVQ